MNNLHSKFILENSSIFLLLEFNDLKQFNQKKLRAQLGNVGRFIVKRYGLSDVYKLSTGYNGDQFSRNKMTVRFEFKTK